VTSQLAAKLDSLRLCSDCVGESFLRAEIEKRGQAGICFYCEGEGKTFSIGEMADEIETAFEEHFYCTPTGPSDYDYAMVKERGWYRDGNPAADVMAESAGIEPEPAEDIRKVLAERHFDWELAKMGEENPFDESAYYGEGVALNFDSISTCVFEASAEKPERRG
jgi:hypothetical protein